MSKPNLPRGSLARVPKLNPPPGSLAELVFNPKAKDLYEKVEGYFNANTIGFSNHFIRDLMREQNFPKTLASVG